MSLYHKDQPIWWNLSGVTNRPLWIPKGRKEQAGWVKSCSEKTVIIGMLNEGREEEIRAVPIEQVRPRGIPY